MSRMALFKKGGRLSDESSANDVLRSKTANDPQVALCTDEGLEGAQGAHSSPRSVKDISNHTLERKQNASRGVQQSV